MKKYLLAFFIFFVSATNANATTDCPFGLVNDPAPGDCSLYVDGNGNYTCDHSEEEKTTNQGAAGVEEKPTTDNTEVAEKNKEYLSEEEMKLLSVAEVAEFFKISTETYRQELSNFLKKEIKASDSLQALHDNDGLCAGVAAGIASSLKDASLGGTSGASISDTLSEHDLISGQELKTKTVAEVALLYGVSSSDYSKKLSEYLKSTVKPSDSMQTLHDNFELSPSTAKDIASTLVAGTKSEVSSINKQVSATEVPLNKAVAKSKPKYLFVLTVIMTLALYLISFLTYKAGYISLLTHRRIWNVILLIAFLISGIFGLMLVLAINYGWFLPVYKFILYWHVEFGMVMAIITFFHIAGHIEYYACIFRKKKDKCLPEQPVIKK